MVTSVCIVDIEESYETSFVLIFVISVCIVYIVVSCETSFVLMFVISDWIVANAVLDPLVEELILLANVSRSACNPVILYFDI